MIAIEDRKGVPFIRIPALSQYPDLVAAFSTRLGGISLGPYDSLNLGRSTDDDPGHVAENRRRFFEALEISANNVVFQHQVHGTDVRQVQSGGFCGEVDASFTTQPNCFLTVTTADCVPVLLFDPTTGVCGAAHAGWRGTAENVVAALIQKMQSEAAVHSDNVVAVIGPSIGPDAYEVGEEVAAHFDASCVTRRNGKIYLDLWKANRLQLENAGVKDILSLQECTASHPERYFSHRKSGGRTGRMLAVIGRRK